LLAWTVIGVSMGLVLYEAAFATINREFASDARRSISILTLFGGFASTVFWPLTLKLNSLIGWRDTYLVYACVQLLVCAPLHAWLPVRAPRAPRPAPVKASYTLSEAVRHPAFWWLAAAFAANSFVFSALSVHLIPLLQRMGHAVGTVVFFAALIGPMQVAGRIGEMAFARHASPRSVGMVTFAILPIALFTFVWKGEHEWVALAFCLLYGLSNGIITIVRGTLPQELFGAENYGAISGAMAGPSLVLKAAGPVAVAWIASATPSVRFVLGIFLAVSLISLACYRLAIRAQQGRDRGDKLVGALEGSVPGRCNE
jgi:predicted MFS family arabinose efflux permease